MRIMRKINSIILYSGVFVLLNMLTACGGDPLQPGHEYMPDMYRSKSYETYTENHVFSNGIEAQQPVEGTVPRGYELYPYKNTPEGYEKAGAELKNPLLFNESNTSSGKELYTNFCIHCHGESGKGDGKVATNPKFPGPPPAFDGPQLSGLSEGKMFHTITYGKGNMGSHASQLTKEERWKIICYIQKLQGKQFASVVAGSIDSLTTNK